MSPGNINDEAILENNLYHSSKFQIQRQHMTNKSPRHVPKQNDEMCTKALKESAYQHYCDSKWSQPKCPTDEG